TDTDADADTSNFVGDPAATGTIPYEVRGARGDVLVRARDVEVSLGGRTVLKPTSLEVREGEVVALLGRNGAGKTTLLRVLAQAQAPSGGAVDAEVPVAHVPQEPDSLLFRSTVRAEVASTLELLGRRD